MTTKPTQTQNQNQNQKSPSKEKREYDKKRTTTKVGKIVSIPGHAVGITIADLSPFGESVQISWLEPIAETDHGVTNEFTVYSNRTNYADTSPVEIPYWAVAKTLYEPLDSVESVVYYLG
jgi:hypothetical protein